MNNVAHVAPRCWRCDYLKEGLSPGAACPECGEGPSPSSGLCIVCGYSLEGLGVDGVCPECATPVALSRSGAMSEPGHVARVRRGVMLVHVSILLMIAAGALTVISVSLALILQLPLSLPLLFALSFLAYACTTPLLVFGWWRVTEADKAVAAISRGEAFRRTTRAAAVAFGGIIPLFVLLSVVSAVLPVPTGPSANTVTVTLAGLQILLGLLWYASIGTLFFASMLYIKVLGQRLGDGKIVRMAKFRIWFCPTLAMVLAVALYLGPLVGLILYYNLLVKLRKSLSARLKWLEALRSPGRAVTS